MSGQKIGFLSFPLFSTLNFLKYSFEPFLIVILILLACHSCLPDRFLVYNKVAGPYSSWKF